MSFESVTYYTWLGVMPLAVGWMAYWVVTLPVSLDDVVPSLRLSGAASLPGALLWMELGLRFIAEKCFGAREVMGYDFSTILLSCSWLVVGPLLLVGAFAKHPKRGVVPGSRAMLALHTCLWLHSTAVALIFAVHI